MNMSTLCTIKYMNRSYFSKARYMIGVGFKILGRTPVTKLPPKLPPSLYMVKILNLCQNQNSFNDWNTGYPHDGSAENAAYPYDGRADNAAYPHDSRDNVAYLHDGVTITPLICTDMLRVTVLPCH